jgi:transposase
METRDARSLPSKAQEALRLRVVAAEAGGRKQVEVAEIFGVTRQALGRWVKAWREGGEKALKGKRQGRPIGGSLDRK